MSTKRSLFCGSRRSLMRIIAIGCALFIPLQSVHAASWQWSSVGSRERVVINLDSARQDEHAGRSGTTELRIKLKSPLSNFALSGNAPEAGSIVSDVSADNGAVRIKTRDAAFGYIVSRPGQNQVIIDIFSDPLGTRWRSPGSPAPVGAASRAASAQPQPPVIAVPPKQTKPAQPAIQIPQRGTDAPAQIQPEIPAKNESPKQRLRKGVKQNASAVQQPEVQTPAKEPSKSQNAALPEKPASAERIPMPNPGQTGGGNTTLGKMAKESKANQAELPKNKAGQSQQTKQPTSLQPAPLSVEIPHAIQPKSIPPTQQPAPAGQKAAGQPSGVQAGQSQPAEQPRLSPAELERRILQSPGATGETAGVTGKNTAPQPPSENDLNAITSRIEKMPANPEDNHYAYPDLDRDADRVPVPQNPAAPAMPNVPASPAPDVNVQPQSMLPEGIIQKNEVPKADRAPGSAERAALERELAKSTEAQQRPEITAKESGAGMPPAATPPAETRANTQRSQRQVMPGEVRAHINPRQLEYPELELDGVQSFMAGVREIDFVPSDMSELVQMATAEEEALPILLAANEGQVQPRGQQQKQQTGGAAENKKEPGKDQPVLYIDEEGHEVPKPPDLLGILKESEDAMKGKKYQDALDALKKIKDIPQLTQEQREKVLYSISEATEQIYKDKWLEGYEPIVATTNEAMNYNLRSPRIGEALLRLGMINLRTGNQNDASGYFGALRSAFPLKPEVATAYLALGRDQFDKGQYAESVQTFQLILNNYPQNRAVREASRYMAEALYKQGHDKRAMIMVDFVNRRWPRLYLEDTDYLLMVGDLLYRENRADDALQTYWTYYNLRPDNPGNAVVLLNIGTIYMQTGFLKGAKDVFEELLRKYPKSAAAPVALRRLGEDGIYDGNPSLDALFAMFGKPSPTSPEIYYQKILDSYPKSAEAPVAAVRLASWRFWNKDTAQAMAMAQDFIRKHPNSPYGPRAEEIIRRGFNQEFERAMNEENYDRVLTLWDRYPEVQLEHPVLSDDLRVALARAHLNRGEEDAGMDLLAPFLDRPKDAKYGDYVYNLFLARALRKEDWNGILDIGEKVSNWKMAVPDKAQLDYSRAISAENLGLPGRALPLWRALHTRNDIPLYQKAYANYFMAREAERQRDLDNAYKYNLDTLQLFNKLREERSDKADPERIRESLAALMDVTEVMNRFAESLDWADKYVAFVPKESPDYAAWQFRVARLHRKMGNMGKWRALLDEIVAREPESIYGKMASSELHTQDVARDLTRFTQNE